MNLVFRQTEFEVCLNDPRGDHRQAVRYTELGLRGVACAGNTNMGIAQVWLLTP